MRVKLLSLAVVISALVHALALTAPGWHLPEEELAESSLISATLLAPPAGKSAASIKKTRPKRAKPKPLPEIEGAPIADLGPTQSEPLFEEQSSPLADAALSEQASPPAAQSAPIAAQSTEPAAQSTASAELAVVPLSAWSRQGRVSYTSSYMGIPISGVQTWSHNGAQFSASLRGSIPIGGELINQASVGRIVAGRPVSDQFNELLNRRKFETQFDVPNNKVRQDRKGDKREVDTGGYALDMLALTHFMALQPMGTANFDVFVVTFRGSVSRVTIEQRPVNNVVLPLGTVLARQFHAEGRNGELKIDIWLSVAWNNAPLRIRVRDKENAYDLKAVEVEVDGKILGQTPVAQYSDE